MAAVIELLLLPTILVTIAVVVLATTGATVKTVFAMAVALALFYFVVIALLRFMRNVDKDIDREIHSH